MDEEKNIFQVKNPRLDLPYISKHLKVGVDKYYGRYIFTTSALLPGDVIAIEEPFLKSLEVRGTSSKKCVNCLNRCKDTSLSCHNCDRIKFCSQSCKDKAELCHNEECHFLEKIEDDDGYFLLMMRILIKSINTCGNVEMFQHFIESRDKNVTIFDSAVESDFGRLNCFYNLESGNFPEDIKFSKTFIESEIMRKFYSDKNQKFFLMKILLKIMGILNRNSFCIDLDDDDFCGAIFLFASFFNHSCSPQIDRVSLSDGRSAFICNRLIEENEQLFICYRRQFYSETKTLIRQRELFEQFDFVCQCEACINPEIFSITYKEDDDDDDDEENFRINRQYIIDNITNYPSYELINAMHKNRKFFQRRLASLQAINH